MEDQAVYRAHLTARCMGFDNILEVETDCATPRMHAYHVHIRDSRIWHIEALVHDILHLQRSCLDCSFHLISRYINKVANWDIRNQPELAHYLCTADSS